MDEDQEQPGNEQGPATDTSAFAPGLDAAAQAATPEEQGGGGGAEGAPTAAWEDLANRLQSVLGAEQGGGQPGSLAGTPANTEPTGLPQLDRIAAIAEQLESVLSNPPEAAYSPIAGPRSAQRAEDILPGPTSLPGIVNPQAAWHGGAAWGLDEGANPTLQQPEPPAYEGGFAGELPPPAATSPTLPTSNPAPEASAAEATWEGQRGAATATLASPDYASAPPPPAYEGNLTPGLAPPEALAADWGEAGAPPGASGGFAGGEPTTFQGGGFPPPAPVEYNTPLVGGGAEAGASPAVTEGGGAQPEAGAFGELRQAIDELRLQIGTLGKQQGPRERRPGPQRDGSFVPGGPGLLGGSFGTLAQDYVRGD